MQRIFIQPSEQFGSSHHGLVYNEPDHHAQRNTHDDHQARARRVKVIRLPPPLSRAACTEQEVGESSTPCHISLYSNLTHLPAQLFLHTGSKTPLTSGDQKEL